MSKKLVLFDIDHTVVDCGGTHRKVFADTFKELCNINFNPDSLVKCSGFTDLQIIYDIMDSNKIERDPKLVSKIMALMIELFKKENLDHSVIMDGVTELLQALQPDEDIVIGLVTGNLEEIAYAKLKHLNIDEFFILGGFGDISDIRAELIEEAIKKASKDFGKIEKENVIVIGDTIHDIKAAKDAGVRVVAVATGTNSYGELERRNPDYLLDNLKDTRRILEIIKNGKRLL